MSLQNHLGEVLRKMKVTRKLKLLSCIVLAIIALSLIVPAGLALAQEVPPAEPPPPPPKIELNVPYPTLQAVAGETFEFEMQFRYIAATDAPRDFTLKTTVPKGWDVVMTPQYEKEKKLSAIRLAPAFSFGNTILVSVSSPPYPLPDPGDYKVTFEATSGDLKASMDLTATITAKYSLTLLPPTGRYNMTAKAGKDNYFSIEAGNLGTANIDNITFSTTKPDGWSITFSPEKIESLKALDSQTIQLNVKPAANTISGDYSVSITATGKQAMARNFDLRVTVETPTVWGWVGVGVIVVVVVGLIGVFMRFSRR